MNRWKQLYEQLQEQGSASCPNAEQLTSLVVDEGPERAALADHVVGCRRCSGLTRDLLALHREARTGSRREVIVRRGWIAAAAAMVGIGFGLMLWQETPLRDPVLRGQGRVSLEVEPPDRATLAAPPASLRWPPDAEAESYRVVLLDHESTPIWESPILTEADTPLPETVRARLRPGLPYYWRVTIRSGVEQRQLPLLRFTIAP